MDSSGCTRITSSFWLLTPIIVFMGSRLKRTRSSHTRSSMPLPAVKRKGTPRQRGVSTCRGRVQPPQYNPSLTATPSLMNTAPLTPAPHHNSALKPLTTTPSQVPLTCRTSEAKVAQRDPAGTVSSSW